MARDDVIVWEDEFEIGASILNIQHKQLVESINGLGAIAYGTADTERLLRLNYFMRMHFETEEQFLRIGRFPMIDEHVREHALFYQSMHERITSGGARRDEIKIELARWFSQHLEAEGRNPFFRRCVNINRLA